MVRLRLVEFANRAVRRSFRGEIFMLDGIHTLGEATFKMPRISMRWKLESDLQNAYLGRNERRKRPASDEAHDGDNLETESGT
jgi:hypothetical protein